MAYYHFVLPHHSLRQVLDTPEPTRGAGTQKRWKPVTPAMAAGITDHVWTTTELLSYRVPAQFLEQLSMLKPLFALPEKFIKSNEGQYPNTKVWLNSAPPIFDSRRIARRAGDPIGDRGQQFLQHCDQLGNSCHLKALRGSCWGCYHNIMLRKPSLVILLA